MKNILYIQCSPKTAGSHSGTFAQEFVKGLSKSLPAKNVVLRDLSNSPIPHVSSQHTLVSEKPESMRNAAEQQALQLSDTLIAELEATDVLVIATPMHNYTVPSVLKAWIDHGRSSGDNRCGLWFAADYRAERSTQTSGRGGCVADYQA
nr:NAD(P)H-dependent oxidoreductase [Methylophilus sp.]